MSRHRRFPRCCAAAVRHRRASDLARAVLTLLGLAVVALAAPAANAGLTAYTYFESTQTDQIVYDPLEYFHDGATDSDSGTDFAQATGSLDTPYASHTFDTRAAAITNAAGVDVSLAGWRNHEFDMRGTVSPTSFIGWISSDTYIYSNATFVDQATFAPQGGGLPELVKVEYVWRVDALFTQILDIPDNERPLYRLTDRIHFTADAGGAELAAVDIDVTTYDPHAPDPPPMWSVLQEDVNLIDQPAEGASAMPVHMTAVLQEDGMGGYLPLNLNTALTVESWHKFLNDGPEINSYLKGEATYSFSNSVDLVGLIVWDETDTARTDVIVTSAAGIAYTLLPDPATLALLAVGGAGLLLRRRTAGGQ
jgi:hypothetical protein